MDAVEAEIREEILPILRDMPELTSPDKFPIELKEPFKEFLDFSVPQIRAQSEERVRQQLENVVEWARLSALEVGLKSFANSSGYFLETEHMIDPDGDYETFIPASERERTEQDAGFDSTPHTVVELSPFELIGGDEYWTQEIFDILILRFEQLYPSTMVPHYRIRFIGYGEDKPGEFRRNGMVGSTTNAWWSESAPRVSECHRLDDGLTLGPSFRDSYLERIGEWRVAQDDNVKQVAADDDSSLSDLTSLNGVIQTGSEYELELNQPGLDQIKIDIREEEIYGETFDTIGFYDDKGDLVLVYTLDDPDAEIEVFPPGDIPGIGLDYRFTGAVWDAEKKRTALVSRTDRDVVTEDGIRTAITGNWDDGFEEPQSFDSLLDFDTDWSFDGEFDAPYLAAMRNGGYWEAADSSTSSTSFPHLDATALLDCEDFDMRYSEGIEELVFSTSLTRSPLFGETFDLVRLFDPDGNVIVVSKFTDDGVGPITVDDQKDSSLYELRLTV